MAIRCTFTTQQNISDEIFFAKIVNDWKALTIFGKNFILDVWLGSEYNTKSRLCYRDKKYNSNVSKDLRLRFANSGWLLIIKLSQMVYM